ncbi:MAG TPA: efflux RND transporter periplasmic adaptor subunit, partial [Alistipes obesi]|nr:efflux RND transporter periplasmic adaptor subunit [Alistipes communis]
AAGERIVTSGVHRLREGEKVAPLPGVTKTNVGGLL